jgi:hypothetical protein
MKIKKLLPLVLLAVTAILMLSSCDAMLDAIFPSDQISVDVMVYKNYSPAFHIDWQTGDASTVALTLTDVTTGVSSTLSAGWSDIDSNYVHYVFTFLRLKDHVYSLSALYYSVDAGPTPFLQTQFWDGSTISMYAVQMPYRNGHDSTGHSADFQMYFY